MAQLTLSGWFTLELFQVLLVFVRVSAAMMLLPGFGEPAVPVRIRVLTGLAIGAALTPTIAGLPDAVRARLFQPGVSGKPGGSGLGLARSQQLALQAGGSLELQRSDAAGTCFRLVLAGEA